MLKMSKWVLVIFLIAGFKLSAQTITANWGPVVKGERKTEVTGIVGKDTSGYYVLIRKIRVFNNNTSYLAKYNSKNEPVFYKELVIPGTDGKDMTLEKMLMFNGKLLVFTSFYNKKQDKNYAFVNTVSPDGVIQNDAQQIDEITSDKKRNAGNFDFMLSLDSSKLLVYHNEPYEKNAQEKFNLKIMDQGMNVIWEKAVQLPYHDKDFTVSNYLISNDNRVYMLAKIQEGKRDKKKGRPNYSYSILGFSNDKNSKPDEYEISLGKLFISDITFELDKFNNLVCAGFYSKDNSSDLGGTFYMLLSSKSKKVLKSNTKEFSQDILEQFMSERKAKKNKELGSYTLRKMIPISGGGSMLIAEQYYVIVVTTTDPKTHVTTTHYYYHYNDIIAVKINKDGTIDWATRIPKFQVSEDDGGYFSSFALAVYKDKLMFVYNDNKKNLTIADPKKIKATGSFKKTVTVLVVLDANGEYTKQALFNNKDAKVVIRPKMALQSGANELILYATRGKDDMFGTLTFE